MTNDQAVAYQRLANEQGDEVAEKILKENQIKVAAVEKALKGFIHEKGNIFNKAENKIHNIVPDLSKTYDFVLDVIKLVRDESVIVPSEFIIENVGIIDCIELAKMADPNRKPTRAFDTACNAHISIPLENRAVALHPINLKVANELLNRVGINVTDDIQSQALAIKVMNPRTNKKEEDKPYGQEEYAKGAKD